MEQVGLSESEAKSIENQYHNLYVESDTWVHSKLVQASKEGYVTGCFGLRLRTPVIAQVVYGNRMPHKASEEGRTAGNMLGQSYGLLNLRTLFMFMDKVWKSEYKYKIKPICSIHDSTYLIIENSIGCLKFVNDNLIEEMQWQNLHELKHDIVKLGGELDIFPENWSKAITIGNDLSKQEILNLCKGK